MIINFIKKIKNYFRNREVQKKKWIEKLIDLGFKDIHFPILIIGLERNGINFELLDDFEDFAMDPDLYFFPWKDRYKILDSNGNLWKCKYDNENKTNIPAMIIETLSLEDVKIKVKACINGYKKEEELKENIDEASTIEEVFNELINYFI